MVGCLAVVLVRFFLVGVVVSGLVEVLFGEKVGLEPGEELLNLVPDFIGFLGRISESAVVVVVS